MLKECTIPDGLKRRAQLSGEAIAYLFDGVSYTWQEVDQLSRRIAARLRQWGIRKGTRVGLLGVNSIEWVLCYYAVLRIGGVAVLLNYSYQAEELKAGLKDIQVQYLLVGEAKNGQDYERFLHGRRATLPDLNDWERMSRFIDWRGKETEREPTGACPDVPVFEEDVALIIFTSGTTASPRGVELMHGQLMEAMGSVVQRMGWTKEDRLVLPLPLYHGSGANCGLLVALHAGMSAVLLRTFRSIEVMEAIQKYRCTVFNAVPAMPLLMMANARFGEFDLSSLRSGILSGAVISEETYRKIREGFRMKNFLPAYGMTETTTLNTLTKPNTPDEERWTNAGGVLPGMEVRIWHCREERVQPSGEVGEIQVRGRCIAKGYYGKESLFQERILEGGWFRTGDVGFLDTRGRLHFQSRLSELIVRGGENIVPGEIEAVLEKYSSDIETVKVVGIPDPIMQEELVALICMKSGRLDPTALRAYLLKNLASFKVPRYFFQVAHFAMTGSGKIDLKKARETAERYASEKGDER
ncbi:MAG: class I adenylate-forming enzyme family protein [Ndongobacter sp.]|nr:class I adenylate-forming enzyme family protein [Ndongobacter sp.]